MKIQGQGLVSLADNAVITRAWDHESVKSGMGPPSYTHSPSYGWNVTAVPSTVSM